MKLNDEVYAVIICYNPDLKSLLSNLKIISEQVSKVIIIDNNSANFSEYNRALTSLDNVDIISFPKNEGIAYALNVALNYCEGKSKWLLTLDQDSTPASDMVEKLLLIAEENDSIIAPLIIDRNSFPHNGVDYSHLNSLTAITSGCLNNIDQLLNIGGFDTRLFIDFVDHEMCLRLQNAGLPIKHSKEAILYHSVGNITTHRILKHKITTTNHSPFRRYFLFRNRIHIYKRYFKKFPMWCFKGVVFMFRDIFVILFFERKKLQNAKFIFKGIYHGLIGCYNNSIMC